MKAQEEFEYWLEKGDEFYDDFQGNVQKERYNKAAFYLHQATESYYTTCPAQQLLPTKLLERGCVKSRSSSDFARTKVHLEHPKALYILPNDLKMTF